MRDDDPITPEHLEQSRRRVRRHLQEASRRRARQIVGAIALLAAIAATFADGAPTGLTPVDTAYRAGFAVLVVLATTRAKRWTWFVLAGVAGAIGSDAPSALGLSALGLAVSFASLRYGRRQREFGAVVGALAAQAFLRLPAEMPIATPVLAATVALLPVVASALQNVRRPSLFLWPALGVVLLAGIAAAGFVVGMLTIESHAQDGVAASRDGLDAATRGDDAASVAAFTVADREFAVATRTTEEWWMAPARVLPVLAPHVDAVRDVARQGRVLAGLGADQASVLDIRGLSNADGGFDLASIADLAPRAVAVADALDEAAQVLDDADSPWLIAPVADRIDSFAAEIADVAPNARLAADALVLAPRLLGAERVQTYVALVGNPAESRELGGFVASVGVLTADDGDLDFESLGSISGLNRQIVDAGLAVDGELPAPLPSSSPERFVQNWANTADFSVVGEIARQLGPAFTNRDVDGVLYLDPYALAALMEITGPVTIEERAEPLQPEDAVDYLLREQYQRDDFDDDGERKDRLRDTADAAFDELTSSSLPDPRRLADRLSPLVRARRLLFTTSTTEAHELLERVGLRPLLDLGAADQILLAQENLRANKLDAYLERAMTYDIAVGEDGSASGTLTVDLTNTAPEDGLGDYVTGDGSLARPAAPLPAALNRMRLDLYSRLDVDDVTIDGESTGTASNLNGDLVRTATRVDVPPGTTVRVVFTLSGNVGGGAYDLEIVPTATAGVDAFSGTLTLPQGDVRIDETPLDRVIRVEPPR